MSDFLIGASAFAVVALLLVGLPWIIRSRRIAEDELTNTRLVKHRLSELQVEQQQGLLSDRDREQAESELKLSLLEEASGRSVSESRGSIWLLSGALIAVAIAGWVYVQVNQLGKVEQWQQAIEQMPELGKRINDKQDIGTEELQQFALGLRTRLHEEPDNPVGWMLLGRVCGALNQPQTAKEAFERSLKLNPQSVGTLMSYAQALILIGSESDLQQAQRVLQNVLLLEPENVSAIGTLALISAELGDTAGALAHWQTIQGMIAPDDANYALVAEKIRELSGLQVPMNAAPADTGKRVSVTVELAAELQGKLPQAGVIFVFAQDPSGQVRMPVAVVKLPLGDFPLTVELNDSNAMLQDFNLSTLREAKLVARVSRDENVAQAPGELQGEIIIDLDAVQPAVANIMINKEIM